MTMQPSSRIGGDGDGDKDGDGDDDHDCYGLWGGRRQGDKLESEARLELE